MNIIKLKFSNDNTLISWAVRLFTWSRYSHVDYVFHDGRCFSSLPKNGVGFNNAPTMEEEYVTLYVKDRMNIEYFLLGQCGKKYDWKAIFSMPFNRDWHDDSDWFCSELISAALEKDVRLFDKPNHRITPKELYNQLKKRV